ncbi:YVTN family beta-propeller protein/VCBS repeat-containing protein [Mycolicibacterium iranicum]|uniref:YVTN family beta-propeller protein/VCBS repeat-containing protein n=1 Tax=Mycolicibacterium iranicum TaxID=912594 RepID=A0A839Q939_MYCIR|nr:Ig-like domain-containing protein [Mycolicibacterium iranicum]MBB2992500.1 YVTN family beta-propeller protein/VCBS repeat-containing protein [Mycolicibacterium iranicum]
MRHSHYVGRIGALAFALGVGFGLAGSPGIALADDGAGASNSVSESPAGDTTTEDLGSENPGPSDGDTGDPEPPADEEPADVEPEDEELPADEESEDEDPAPETGSDGSGNSAGSESAPTPAPEEVAGDDADLGTDAETTPDPEPAAEEPVAAPAAADPEVPAAEPAAAEDVPAAPPAPADQSPAPASASVTLSSILASLLGPAGAPEAPTESPLWWVLAGAARRQLGLPDSTKLTGASGNAIATALLTPEQAAAISRLGEVLVGTQPTDVVATDTRAYVANSGSKSITVIDTLTGSVIDTITLFSNPAMMALTPGGSRLYVTGVASGRVSVISTATNSLVASIRVGKAPTGIAISPNGSSVYVVNGEDGTVSRISTLSNTVTGTIFGVPEGTSTIAVSPDGLKIYTTSDTGDVSYFSPFSLVATTIASVTPGSLGLTFGADSSRVYLSDPSGSVHIIDTATHEIVDSIAVGAGTPFDVAVSPDGTTLFVARSGDGKLSVYDIASKAELTTVVANPYLVDGPAAIAVSPDGTQLYWADFSNNKVHLISLTGPNQNPVAGAPVVNAPNGSGVVTGSVGVTDPEGNPLTATASRPGKGTVTVTRSGDGFTFTYTPSAAARHAAAATGATADQKQDTFVLTISDSRRGVITVPVVVTIAPANAAPTATVRSSLSWFSATVRGTVTGRDTDRDTLTYTASPTAKGGTVVIDEDGRFTYNPTAAARHTAAAAGATAADKQDTFDVVVDDGHGGVRTITVTVKVKPGNNSPSATVSTSPSWFSADVYGRVTARDLDRDGLTYTASATDKGGVVVMSARGRFTYTPTEAARHAAAAAGAGADDKVDTFDIVVDDGHGGTATVAVTVRIKPLNSRPSGVDVADQFTNLNSGLVTGKITADEADGDTLTFSAPESTRKGTITVNPDGTFTYTPTAEARAEASERFAPSWDRIDRFRVTVDDGHGGTTSVLVSATIAPLGHVNQGPKDGAVTVGTPAPGSGKVAGTVSVTDPERDVITYAGPGGTPRGTVFVGATGAFVYTPTDAARAAAGAPGATENDKRDVFTIIVDDGYGGTLPITVTVPIAGASGVIV